MTDIAFKPYHGKRAFEEIAEEIRQAILTNHLEEGERLHGNPSHSEQNYASKSHKEILEAVKRKNQSPAQRLMKEHLACMGRLAPKGDSKTR